MSERPVTTALEEPMALNSNSIHVHTHTLKSKWKWSFSVIISINKGIISNKRLRFGWSTGPVPHWLEHLGKWALCLAWATDWWRYAGAHPHPHWLWLFEAATLGELAGAYPTWQCVCRRELAGWPSQLPPRLRSRTLHWPTPASTPPRNWSWSTWRDWSSRFKAAGSPGTGHQKDIPVRIPYCYYSWSQSLQPDQPLLQWACGCERVHHETHYSVQEISLFCFLRFFFFEGGRTKGRG